MMTQQRTLTGLIFAAAGTALWLAGCTGPAAPSSSTSSRPTSAASLGSTRADAVQSVEPWTYNHKLGKNIRTANYSIYTTQDNPVLTGRLPGFVEAALRHYTTALGPLPSPPSALESFIMSSRGEWERLTQQLMGTDAQVYLRIPRGGYAAGGRGVYYDIGTADTLAIAGHEGWHQYTQRTFKQPLPTWLEEGVATYMEGHRWEGPTPRFLGWANTERFDQLRSAAAAGTLLPLEQLISTSPQDLLNADERGRDKKTMTGIGAAAPRDRLLTYYAQLWALVHFLEEGEEGKYSVPFRQLLADAASGELRAKMAGTLGERATRSSMMMRRGPAAIVAYFNTDVHAFGAEYRAFTSKVVAVRSRDRIVAGLSPLR